MWVRGLVVKTDDYSTEGPEYDFHPPTHISGIKTGVKTILDTLGALVGQSCSQLDLEINLLKSLRFVCSRREARWFSPSSSASSTIITDFPVSPNTPSVLGWGLSWWWVVYKLVTHLH